MLFLFFLYGEKDNVLIEEFKEKFSELSVGVMVTLSIQSAEAMETTCPVGLLTAYAETPTLP